MIKQRKESKDLFKSRKKRSKKEKKKKLKLLNLLPKQIKAEELEKIIKDSIKELDCQSLKDLGKLISNLKENYPGQIDMREVADLAKKNLK